MTALLRSADIDIQRHFHLPSYLYSHDLYFSPKYMGTRFDISVFWDFVASLTLPKNQIISYMWPGRSSAFVRSTHVDIYGVWGRFPALGNKCERSSIHGSAAQNCWYINFAHCRSFMSSSLHLQGVFSKIDMGIYHVLRRPPLSFYCVSKRQSKMLMVPFAFPNDTFRTLNRPLHVLVDYGFIKPKCLPEP